MDKRGREFLPRVENIFAESGIFLPSREYFCGVENNFFMSNSDNQSKIFSGVEIFCRIEIFSSSREYPTCHAVICRQNDQTICRFADLLVT